MDDILRIIVIFGSLGFSVIFHEMAHAWSALKLGDPTGKEMNRLSWNPIHHIDPFMTVLIPILLYLGSGGRFIFGGAKPVQINPLNFENPSKGMMLSSAAGPLSNLALALAAGILIAALTFVSPGLVAQRVEEGLLQLTYAGFLLFYMTFINVVLAAFNLIPIPPLDGSKVVRHFAPEGVQNLFDRLEPIGLVLLLGIMFVGGFGIILEPVIAAWFETTRALFGDEMAFAVIHALFKP